MDTTIQDDYGQRFAARLGTEHAFAFWKGRVAWYAILRALGVGVDDEVILPGYTCVMDVNPIMYVGAKPVYVDIDPVTYNLDPDLLEALITPRTRVIVAQHTYGYPAALDPILTIAGKHGVSVVEDCCLALGARYRGRPVGTFGVASYFSFQWNKPYTSGIGGMAVTDDAALAREIRAVRDAEMVRPGAGEVAMLASQLAVYRTAIYPRTTALATRAFRWLTRKGLVVGSSDASEYRPEMADDFFKGMSRLQAWSGRRQLGRLEQNLAHRRWIGARYDELLTAAGWPRPALPAELEPVPVRYPIRVADKTRALATAGQHFVELGSWFECPLHPIETPLEAYGYVPGMCPVAERACREVVNLPTHLRANSATAERTVAFVSTIGPPNPSART